MKRAIALVIGLLATLTSAGAAEREPSVTWRDPDPPAPFSLPGAHTTSDLTAAQRELLTGARDRWGSGFAAVLPQPRTGSVEEDFVLPLDGVDIDGDGFDELLTGEVRVPQTFEGPDDLQVRVEIAARSGADASLRWKIPVGTQTYYSVQDVAGDARPELVLVELSGASVPTFFVWGGVSAFTQRLRVIDIRSGEQLWERTTIATTADEWTSGGALASTSVARDLIVSIRTMPDADDDGERELFVGSIDIGGVGSAGASGYTARARAVTFEGVVLDAATGGEVASSIAEGIQATRCGPGVVCETSGYPWIEPGADVSGDGLADLIAVAFPAAAGGSLQARGVTCGCVYWTRPVQRGWLLPTIAEMSGEGAAEVIVWGSAIAANQWSEAFEVWHGIYGYARWSEADPFVAAYWRLAGDADGDGGVDVLMGGWSDRQLRHGRWGAVLWEEDLAFDEPPDWDGGSIRTCSCDDLDGDGVVDIEMIGRFWLDEAYVGLTITSFDGRTGARMAGTGVLDADVYEPVYLDGDAGGADLALAQVEGAPRSATVTVIDGATLAVVFVGAVPTDAGTYDEYFTDMLLADGRFLDGGARQVAVGLSEFGYQSSPFEVQLERLDTHMVGADGIIWSLP